MSLPSPASLPLTLSSSWQYNSLVSLITPVILRLLPSLHQTLGRNITEYVVMVCDVVTEYVVMVY